MSEETTCENRLNLSPEVIRELEEYLKLFQKDAPLKSKKTHNELENVTLNIAVTGESGVGKSTFVNAIRGLREGDDGSAETGATEITMKAIRYSHPTMPNVYIWDLPGIGKPNFKAKNYLKEVQFDTYDFFFVICSVRFKENDILLAREIKRMKKMFYFVRSKIDQDVYAETCTKDVTEDMVLSQIRQNCEENLKTLGNVKVFLISNFDLGKYDLQNLIATLETNLPEHKRSALIRSLPVCSLTMIEKKMEDLNKSAESAAGAACATAAIPIPGLSVGCEIGIMQEFLQRALISFGLDERSLKRVSERVNKPEEDLRSVMKSRFAAGVNEKVVAKMMRTKAMVAAKTFEVFLATIPALGTVGAMGIAFSTTLQLLREGIKEMAEDAKAVLSIVMLENTPKVDSPLGVQGENMPGVDSPLEAQGENVQGVDSPSGAQGENVQGVDSPLGAQGENWQGVDSPLEAQGENWQGVDSPLGAQGENVQGVDSPLVVEYLYSQVDSQKKVGAQGENVQGVDSPMGAQGENVQGVDSPMGAQGENVPGVDSPMGAQGENVPGVDLYSEWWTQVDSQKKVGAQETLL